MRRKVNIAVTAILLIAFVVLCFFQQCNMDLYFLIAAFAVLVIGSAIAFFQEKKLKELNK